MKEVFIIERSVAPGIWELLIDTFYLTEDEATESMKYISKRLANANLKYNPPLRVKKLQLSNTGK